MYVSLSIDIFKYTNHTIISMTVQIINEFQEDKQFMEKRDLELIGYPKIINNEKLYLVRKKKKD